MGDTGMMSIDLLRLCVVGLTASLCLTAWAHADILPNTSFERTGDKGPVGWKSHVWDGKGDFAHAQQGRTGTRSVRIASTEGGDLSWETVVGVRPWATYRLSGWIKTKDVTATTGKGALLNVHQLHAARTRALTGTNDWTRVEVAFETGESDSIQVNCLFGGWGQATGQAWYDDVRLELIKAETPKPAVSIDARKTREPINPYIYGQFIEHLGRCIYGGIWAEMVQDRKFFYAVGAKESPWRITRRAETFSMDKTDPYCGEQCLMFQPKDDARSGVVEQGGLGVVEGQSYVGYVIAAAEGDVPKLGVALASGGKPQAVEVGPLTKTYKRFPLRFTAATSTDDARLIISAGCLRGSIRIATVSLMPADNVKGMRADTLELLKVLDSPIYRWPGGNFVSGYDWRDGIGPRDKRPPRKNPAWKGIEMNDFGLDEFIAFCRELDTEPLIVVNTGLGDVAMAVQELEYANGTTDTPMGKRRAENGHPEPYNVVWWGIGNEMYGGWQLGHMPLENYVLKHNRFVDAMRKQDRRIKVVAVGALGTWSEVTLARCADHMDLISEHFYCRELPGVYSHIRQIPNNIALKARGHRRYRREIDALKDKDIRIAMDEWNYWYGPHRYGELGVRYYLKDALGIAAGLNEYTRHTDIISMANYAQTVNVIGCIKTTKTQAAFSTTGLPLVMYRKHYGTIPVAVGGDTKPLDVAAAWTKDRKALTVAVVNPMKDAMRVPLTVEGAKLSGSGKVFTITGEGPQACNEPGRPPQVTIREAAFEGPADALAVVGFSATLFVLEVE